MGIFAIGLQGLEHAQASVQKTAERLAGTGAASTSPGTPDTVDISQEMVSLMQARNDFAANIRMLKTADEMQRQVMDLLA
jgi:flagellar hook protein FlgE